MLILKWPHVACQIQGMAYVMLMIFFLVSIGSMSHVDVKKWPWRPVKFKGQGPFVIEASGLGAF